MLGLQIWSKASYQPWLVKYVRSSLMQLICISKVNGCWSQTQRVLVMRQGLRMKVIGWMRTEFYFFYLNYIYYFFTCSILVKKLHILYQLFYSDDKANIIEFYSTKKDEGKQ